VAQSGKPVNIKKGQFLAPHDMKNVIDKARAAAVEAGLPEDSFTACERGASFGYNNLVSDMRSLAIMRETGAPWCSTPPTACSCPAATAPAAAACARWCPCSRVRPWPWAWQACSWKPTRSLQRPVGRPQCRAAQAHEGLLETLVALDDVTKRNGFLEDHFQA
jgi:2-dehydro-3-deoxyphosphooctonate aldolase (KDO 8-P synthase)